MPEPDPEELEIVDPETNYWFEELQRAGYSMTQALDLAITKSVDKHQARELVAKAGPDLAYQIVR